MDRASISASLVVALPAPSLGEIALTTGLTCNHAVQIASIRHRTLEEQLEKFKVEGVAF